MRRFRMGLVAALTIAAPAMLSASITPTASAAVWNCRQVVAVDITLFRFPTGSLSWLQIPNGRTFKSFGIVSNRYDAEYRDTNGSLINGYTTTNSS